MQTDQTKTTPRAGCIDIWNAFMVKGAEFTIGSDMPIGPRNSLDVPLELISFVEAKHIYKTTMKVNPNFHIDAFIHFYMDDYKFDSSREGVWKKPNELLNIARHFSGVISPDFSTSADFVDSLKRWNIYRMRAFDFWLSKNGIPIIYNVRWGTEETWEYCFDGIPRNSVIAIGTVASSINKLKNRPLFFNGLPKAIELINPTAIIVYGSSKYEPFNELKRQGIKIISFDSDTNKAFSKKEGGKSNE